MSLLDDLYNVLRIAQLEHQVLRLQTSPARAADPGAAETELDRLRATVGELRLCVAVLFRVLERKGLVTRAELVELAEQVDAEDGCRDNAYTGDDLP